jgi:hypothetical protein
MASSQGGQSAVDVGDGLAFAKVGYACQFLYGGWFLFHGLNYWCGFYFDRSIQPGPGLVPVLAASGVMTIVKLLEIAIGAALLADRFVALAIVAAWPITLMIAFVTASHGKPFGIGVACVIIALNAIMSFGHLDRYRPMLALHAGPPNLDGLIPAQAAPSAQRLRAAPHIGYAVAGVVGAITITYLSLVLRR